VDLYGPADVLPPYVLGLVTGIASGAAMLPYTVIKEANAPNLAGTATGVVNFLNFTFSALLGPVFGRLLLGAAAGAPLAHEHYQAAFRPMLFGIALAIVLALLLKETGPAAARGQLVAAARRPKSYRNKERAMGKYEELLAKAKGLPPVPTAVAHPCEATALAGAVEAHELGLIKATLVGPGRKIRESAAQGTLDLKGIEIVDAEHSHAAAEKAVALVREGKGGAPDEGSLHTDELLAAVVARETGLRTARRISHVFIMDVPTYHKVIMVTDAAINIAPSLEDKVDICQNAVDLARTLGIATPKVAVLAAVETVNSKMPATIEAAALCKMADRGQIKGALVDGPLAFDNAISKEAAEVKGIRSEVAGDPDILLVPDLESGNMVAKLLTFLAKADSAGLVLGAARADHSDEPRRQRAVAHRELRRREARRARAPQSAEAVVA
jgi:phosphotransacetylase